MPTDPQKAGEAGLRFMHEQETRGLDLEDEKEDTIRKIEKMVETRVISTVLGERWKTLISENSFLELIEKIRIYSVLVEALVSMTDDERLIFKDGLEGLHLTVMRAYSHTEEKGQAISDLVTQLGGLKKGQLSLNPDALWRAHPDNRPKIISPRKKEE